MNDDQLLTTLLDAWNNSQPAPKALHGTVTMDRAYALQMALRDRYSAEGRQQSGWKIGQTNAQMRAERGEHEPAPGFLLTSGQHVHDDSVPLTGPANWFIEPELALIMGRDLKGTDVSARDVQEAVEASACAFEIVRVWDGWKDRALQRAVNGSNAGFVLGPPSPGCVSPAEADELRVSCYCDNQLLADVRAADVNDNPLESTAWLARFLSRFDHGLLAGDIILTGSFAGLLPMQPGQTWATQISDHDAVRVRTIG